MSTLDFKLLKWQRAVMASKKRFKVVVAGRRCGKTRFSAIDMIVKGLECTHTDATVLYVAPTYGMAKTLMWDLLLTLAQPVIAKSNINDGEITLVNGVKLRIRGSDNPDALRGFKLYHVVTDESKDFKLNVWPLIIRPALSDLKGTALIIGTPEPGESEFRDQYELGLNGDEEWGSWHFTTLDNELIDPKEIEAARRTLSTAHFAQEYEASFETMGENIFKESWLLYSDTAPTEGDTFIAVDPAGFEAVGDQTKKKHLDNTAIAVVTVTDDGKWFVRKIEYGRWDVRETAVKILMAIRSHRPMMVGVERGALARALMPYLTDLMRKNNLYAHIEQIQISGSKTNRITYNLQGLFEHGRITLNSREDWKQFRKEYVSFPSTKSHDDLIDSLSLVANLVNTSYMRKGDDEEWEPLDEIAGV
jgi:predicted phage terminase large subunit-like protein